jgi:UDP-2,4-diacetamido-2,4,6-trideoxy-beta-L-altropyranose hydrolase
MPVRIGIRADATPTMGLGHLLRCLALARAMRRAGAEVHFVTRDLGLDSAARIRAAGFGVFSLPAPHCEWTPPDSAPPHAAWAGVPADEDAEQTAGLLRPMEPDRLVIDHYAFDAVWHRRVADALGVRVAAIDDLGDRALDVDVLIDQNLADHDAKYVGRLPQRVRRLLGPRYALLGPRYADAPRHVPSGRLGSIGIFMGGVDQAGMSRLAWHGCRHTAAFDGPIEIATTSANPHLEDLHALASADGRTTLSVDLPDLAAFFAAHDLQIGAGGGATWERCCIGAPTLLLAVAENQRAVLPALSAAGIVATLGEHIAPDATSVGHAVAMLALEPRRLASMSERARRLVDGRGAERVALAMLAQTLSVRPASAADGTMMHRWRNDPATRAVSHHGAEIPLETHLRWLDTVLVDPSTLLLIGCVGQIDVGVIRFDSSGDETRVSVYLDPALHGLGLGPRLLAAGEDAAAERLPPGSTFVADVLGHNDASRRLFVSAGYHFEGLRGRKPVGASHSSAVHP